MSLTYNERSWAIDLISKINNYTERKRKSIVRAGGELTLKEKNQRSLFPDVILYGDDSASRVRHGWELKLPDTKINDVEFIGNAIIKAKRFGVNSFVLWNVKQAVLYASDDGENFTIYHSWPELEINKREDVQSSEKAWSEYLEIILDDLNGFFENGILKSSSVVDILDDNFIVSIIDNLSGLTTDSISKEVRNRASLNADINDWWINNAPEYGEKSTTAIDFNIISKVVLTNWVNRFLFAHYLKGYNNKAKDVETINTDKSINEALNIFEGITSECNFMQVFRPEIATELIGNESWEALCEVNTFLTNLHLDELPPELLQEVIEQTLAISRRKVAGQFSTPFNLAKLLCRISIENRAGNTIDPCCGTGTIPRATYEYKRNLGYSVSDSIGSTWASDKYQFPLQLCTLSMADPEALGHVTQIFKSDVFDLVENRNISFVNPNDGSEVIRALPRYDTILSNLPFVRFEDLAKTNPNIGAVIQSNTDYNLSGRTDLFGFIIMHLRHILQENGRLGLIVSNSWLGTEWGETLRETLSTEFSIKYVITSANGRWFDNADVVTNIIVLEKRETTEETITQFITTKEKIDEWDEPMIEGIIQRTLSINEDTEHENSDHVLYTNNEINHVNQFVTGWSSLFGNIKWLTEIEHALTSASNFYQINRGERRGWNALFYPAPNHGIETEHTSPVLLTARHINTYIASTQSDAFCCSLSKEELQEQGYTGTLNWISKFENGTNGSGKPLPNVLAKTGHYWYEMKTDTQADLVLSMNPGKRLFIAKMENRGFVDQRLIRFTSNNTEVDNELCHALLNSILGLFMIEASGFGRGLGALDLNPTKLNRGLFMLNPDLLSEEQKNVIKQKFLIIINRDVLDIEDEVIETQREEFDIAVLESFGIEEHYDAIRSSLLQIFRIRNSVN